ncbi:MAG TPA: ATP-binding protein [Rhodocyclaceae bacterium]|nr:ATP-binding protein [Rhodocyclaceae bacterium]
MNAALNVLLLEDNPVDYRLLQEELREAGAADLRLTRAEGLAEALACLEGQHFDVVLTDLSVPDSFGIATVEAILGRASETPVVVLTGSENDQTGLAAVHLGAQDYLVKGETGGELLLRSLLYAIERKQAELSFKQSSEQLAERAKKQLGRYNDALQLETVERYRIEAALRESERRFLATFEQSAVGMAHVGTDGRFLRVNHRLCQMLGYSDDELQSLDLPEIVHPEDAELDQPQKKRLLNGAIRDYAQERRLKRKDGVFQRFRETVSLVRNERGEPRYFVAVFEDHGHIPNRRPGDGDDPERQLAECRRELEAVNGELEALSYSVSHDLRAPLRAVSGFSRILSRDYAGQLPAEARQYLDLVSDGAVRLDQLIRDLLSYSRLGRQPLHRQPVDLCRMVAECMHHVLLAYEGRQVEFQPEDLPSWPADPALLREVFLALLDNAVKFTAGRDPVRIQVGADIVGGQLQVHVRDNGIGFDMHYAHKLFGVFQRLHRADEYPGTGIGLAVAQRIVQRHGGRIWAESAPDQGATFFFTLPAGGDEVAPATLSG